MTRFKGDCDSVASYCSRDRIVVLELMTRTKGDCDSRGDPTSTCPKSALELMTRTKGDCDPAQQIRVEIDRANVGIDDPNERGLRLPALLNKAGGMEWLELMTRFKGDCDLCSTPSRCTHQFNVGIDDPTQRGLRPDPATVCEDGPPLGWN